MNVLALYCGYFAFLASDSLVSSTVSWELGLGVGRWIAGAHKIPRCTQRSSTKIFN